MANSIGGNDFSSTIARGQQAGAQSSQRIASGLRINSAADDAAGLAIANRLSSGISASSQGIRNASDGISLVQTAGGSLNSISENIQRLRELALQAANGTLNDNDRGAINAEASQLGEEITRVVEQSQFNGVSLLSSDSAINIQAGASESDRIEIQTANLEDQLSAIGFGGLDLSSAQGAQDALSVLDELQNSVDQANTQFGAAANRLESTIDNLGTSRVQASESRSRLQDADIAREVSSLARERILTETRIALQAQANVDSAMILKLLG